MKLKTPVLVAVLLVATRSHAIPISWNLSGNGQFQSPASWNPPQIPMTGDDVSFDNGASPIVSFISVANSASLTVSTGDVTFDLSGFGYFITGNVDIIGFGAPLGPAPLETPIASLAVNAGSLTANGMVNVFGGSALKGNGTVNTPEVILVGGQLLGGLVVNGNVSNGGTVAPGNPIGTLTINGSYQQSTDATLEIEVGGLTAGTQHDQVVVNGSAFLAGRLDLPIVNGFTPVAGNSIPFLQTPMIGGAFDFITVPNLPVAGPAVQIVQSPAGMLASFVNPTTKSFSNAPGPHSWGSVSTWSGPVPTTTDAVAIVNTSAAPQRIELDLGSTAASRAFAHSVALSGITDPMTLRVPGSTALSAITGVTVGERGRLELGGGDIYSNTVQVNHDGLLQGAGKILGDVVVGTGILTGEATLDPDSLLFGPLFIEQDLTLNADAALQIMIQDEENLDRVTVDQTTALGGRLIIDAANYVAPLGTQFPILVSGEFNGHFDSIETVGNDLIFFGPPTAPPLAALGPETYAVQSYSIGDMNLDGYVDPDDAPDFALGLVDPLQYWSTHGYMFPVQAGNFHSDSSFDFDDIQGFADAVGALSAADIYELIARLSVPEPSTGSLLLFSCLWGTRVGRRRLWSHD